MSKLKVSTDFEVDKCVGALYTGGTVEWVDDLIFASSNGVVNIVQNSSVLHTVQEEEDPVLNFTATKENTKITLITAHKSGLLRLWDMNEETKNKPEIMKTFRSIHSGPISVLKVHILCGGGRVLGTGGADGTMKVWDLEHQYYTHNFRTGNGVCSVIEFHPVKLMCVSGFQSGGLYAWDLTNSKQLHNLEGHYSAVTATKILVEDYQLLSTGRDKVVILWDLNTGEKKRTIPVSGSVEGMYRIPGSMKLILAAESSLVLWDIQSTPRKLLESNVGSEISTLQSYKDNIYAATADQNLLSICPEDLSITNTVVGNNDEILALVHLGSSASSPSTPSSFHMAVACNSPFIRLYKVPEYTCTLVHGHKDTVLCLAVSTQDPTLLASGGKDREIRIWRLKADLLSCLVVGTGHTEAVQGIVFSNLASTSLYSVSKDTTVKFWNVNYEAGQMSSLRTEIAHEKEINCCDVSPGDEMLATGSQDKTCKLWDKNLTLTVTLRGHKRGIWCVRFSPADRLLATGSADGLIKLWSLTENVCVKQLEGHDCSVLSLVWINDQQIASSATDGLIKIWLVSKQECVTTLEQHEEKVWTITSLKQDGVLNLVSGSADGQLITWRDITESAALLKQVAAEKIVLSQQKLSNLLASKQFGQALKLALRLSQPFTALKILKKLNMEEMEKAVLSLDNASIDQLLGYTVKWNTNSKHCEAAQSVLFIILSNYLPDDLLKLSGSRDWVEGLLPYTEKHFQRLSRLQMKSKFTTFLISNIKATAIPQQDNEL